MNGVIKVRGQVGEATIIEVAPSSDAESYLLGLLSDYSAHGAPAAQWIERVYESGQPVAWRIGNPTLLALGLPSDQRIPRTV